MKFPSRQVCWLGIAIFTACGLQAEPEKGKPAEPATAKVEKKMPALKDLIGLNVADASEKAGLKFGERWWVEEPPGIGRAVEGTALDGSKLRLYVKRNEAPRRLGKDSRKPWDREEFAPLIVQGVAQEKDGEWTKAGVTMLEQPPL